MGYSITTNEKDHVIEVKYTDSMDQSASEQILREIIEISTKEKINKILYDSTELKEVPPAEAIFAFFDAVPGNLLHAGYINPGQASLDLEFAEAIATSKNKKGRLFRSREAALAWLRIDSTKF